MAAQNLAMDSFWVDKSKFDEAETHYYEGLANVTLTPLADEVAKARLRLIEIRCNVEDESANAAVNNKQPNQSFNEAVGNIVDTTTSLFLESNKNVIDETQFQVFKESMIATNQNFELSIIGMPSVVLPVGDCLTKDVKSETVENMSDLKYVNIKSEIPNITDALLKLEEKTIQPIESETDVTIQSIDSIILAEVNPIIFAKPCNFESVKIDGEKEKTDINDMITTSISQHSELGKNVFVAKEQLIEEAVANIVDATALIVDLDSNKNVNLECLATVQPEVELNVCKKEATPTPVTPAAQPAKPEMVHGKKDHKKDHKKDNRKGAQSAQQAKKVEQVPESRPTSEPSAQPDKIIELVPESKPTSEPSAQPDKKVELVPESKPTSGPSAHTDKKIELVPESKSTPKQSAQHDKKVEAVPESKPTLEPEQHNKKTDLVELVKAIEAPVQKAQTKKPVAPESGAKPLVSDFSSIDTGAIKFLEKKMTEFQNVLSAVQNQLNAFDARLASVENRLSGSKSEPVCKLPTPACKMPGPPSCKKPEQKKDDNDDVDLFGSESEDDETAAKIKEERLAAYNAKKSKKPALIAKSSIILDVKPWDDETDMKAMEAEVRKIVIDGLLWGASKLVPLAYGIHKLQINCVVEDDKVSIDALQEQIESIEDFVQSVDIAAFNKI